MEDLFKKDPISELFLSIEDSKEQIEKDNSFFNHFTFDITSLLTDIVSLESMKENNVSMSKEDFASLQGRVDKVIQRYEYNIKTVSIESVEEKDYVVVSLESVTEVIKDMFKSLYRAIEYLFDVGSEFFKRWFFLLESLERHFENIKKNLNDINIKDSNEEMEPDYRIASIFGNKELVDINRIKDQYEVQKSATDGVNKLSDELSSELISNFINKRFILGNKEKKGKKEIIKAIVDKAPPLGTKEKTLVGGIYYIYEVDSYEKNPLCLVRKKDTEHSTRDVKMRLATKSEIDSLVSLGLSFCRENIKLDRSTSKYKKQLKDSVSSLEREFKRDKKLEVIKTLNKLLMRIIKRLRDLLVDIIENNGQFLKGLDLYVKTSIKKQTIKV